MKRRLWMLAAVIGPAVVLGGCSGEATPPPATTFPSLEALVMQLGSDEIQQRVEACGVLGKMGPDAAQAVPALIPALKDPEVGVRMAAARALGDIGPAAHSAVPALVARFDYTWDIGEEHGSLVYALDGIGPAGARYLDAVLAPVRKDPDDYWACHRAEHLVLAVGEAGAEPLLRLLIEEDGNPEFGGYMLHDLGPRGLIALSALVDVVLDPQLVQGRYHYVLEAIQGIATDADALPDIRRLMTSSDHFHRRKAVAVMAKIGAPARADLDRAMKDKDLATRAAAAEAVSALDGGSPEALAVLVQALDAKEADIRLVAVRGLRNLSHHDGAVLSALVRLEGDKDPPVRYLAACARIKRDPTGEASIREFVACLKEQSWEIRGTPWENLADVGPAAVWSLIRLAEDPNGGVRWTAVDALGNFGSHGEPAATVLKRALRDADPDVALIAPLALARVQPTVPHIDAVIDIIRKDAEQGEALLNRLHVGHVAPMGDASLQRLARALEDPSADVRQFAARLLVAVRPGTGGARSALLGALASRRPTTRILVIEVLSDHGLDSQSLLPHLRKATTDSDPAVRAAATRAVEERMHRTGPLGPRRSGRSGCRYSGGSV